MKKIVLSIIFLLAVSKSYIVVAETQGRLVLDCPCSLKTISDSAIEIEFGIQSITEEIEYQKLELKVFFTTYKMSDIGFNVAVVDVSDAITLDQLGGRAVVQAKLEDRGAKVLTVRGRPYLDLYQDDVFVQSIALSSTLEKMPLQTNASSSGLAFGAYPDFAYDRSSGTFSLGNVVVTNFSQDVTEGAVDFRIFLCPSNEWPSVYTYNYCEGAINLVSGAAYKLESGQSSNYSFEGDLDPSRKLLPMYQQKYSDVWLRARFEDNTIYQALGSLVDDQYQNSKLNLVSPNIFEDADSNGLIDHHESFFGLDQDTLAEDLDIYLLYGNAISNELGDNLEARAVLGVSLAEKMLKEAGVDASLKIVGMESVGADEGLLNREIHSRLKLGWEEWDGPLSRADAAADFIVYLHNDVERDTSDGLATLNGGGAGGDIFAERIREKRGNFAVVDIDETTRNSTFAHELGHLLGLAHSRRQIKDYSAPAFHWALGHGVDGAFSSVMASERVFGSVRSELFSDPERVCAEDYACGISESDFIEGANAAKALRFTYPQAKKISNRTAPRIYRNYWSERVSIPQGEYWTALEILASDYEDGDLSERLVIESNYDLEKVGVQSVVVSVEDSDKNLVKLESLVEIVSDMDRDAISDSEELALGTDPNDKNSCYDCYVFDGQARIGLRGTLVDDYLQLGTDGALIGTDLTAYGFDGDDQIMGSVGNDRLYGGDGQDRIQGFSGDDQIWGGFDDDFIYGGEGNDWLFGGEGNDLMRGGEGDDVLIGGSGLDFLYGGLGNDKIVGGSGGAIVYGEEGEDIIFVGTSNEAGTRDYIKGFTGQDMLALGSPILKIFEGVFSDSGQEFLGMDLQNGTRVIIYDPFIAEVPVQQMLCTADYSLDDFSDFQGGTSSCDLDGDDVADSLDAFPLDATETLDTDADGTGNNADTDDDNDGVEDTSDAFPLDATETADSDNDGVGDNSDAFPDDATESVDSDSDSVGDNADNCPSLSNTDQLNTDGDTEGDACDSDDDNDGFSDDQEELDGTNPKSRFSCKSGCFSFDVDEI